MTVQGQVVDTQSSQEFMLQVMENVTIAELKDITEKLAQKSVRFRELLSEAHLPDLNEEELYGILRHIFAVRRKARKIVDDFGVEFFRKEIHSLLYDETNPALRLQAFVEALQEFTPDSGEHPGERIDLPLNLCIDIAAELLHFTDPEKYWLWTRWIWDPKQATGSLPLVVEDNYDLSGRDSAEIYTKVGIALSFVRATGEAAGFAKLGGSIFDLDVFLACVYAIYMYTILRMRMTQEFNKVVPQLPELISRLLGVWHFDL